MNPFYQIIKPYLQLVPNGAVDVNTINDQPYAIISNDTLTLTLQPHSVRITYEYIVYVPLEKKTVNGYDLTIRYPYETTALSSINLSLDVYQPESYDQVIRAIDQLRQFDQYTDDDWLQIHHQD